MKKLVPACTALALIATGCSKQKEEPPAAEPKAATPTPVEPTAPSPPPAPPAPPGIQIDPEIHELVKASSRATRTPRSPIRPSAASKA